MKKSLIVIIILMLIIAVGACGSIYSQKPSEENGLAQGGQTSAEEEQKEVYYLVGMHIILPYWQDHRSGFEAAGEELGVKIVFTGENGNDALRQVDIFEQAVKAKPAGILVSPIDKDAMTGPINDAIAQGIPVACIDNDAPESKRLTYIGTDNYKSGYLAADIIGEKLGGTGDVGILTIKGLYSLDERQRGFEECMAAKYPGIHVVAVMNDDADPSVAANAAKQMLDEYPSITGMFGTDAASGVGAAIALEEKGKLGVVKVVAFDKDSSVLELVKQGKIEATLVQRTFTMSYYGLKLLYDYNHNGNLKNKGISMLPDKIDTGIIVVTKDNVDSFY
jgi:ribose transport system substrate-binding protein